VQLLATTGVSAVFKSVPAVQTWVQANQWMMWVSLFSTIAVLIGLFVVRKKYPANFYLLGAFTYLSTISRHPNTLFPSFLCVLGIVLT
jgi:FtsH-binding integral membrane protein